MTGKRATSPHRHGVVLVTIVVLISIALALFGIWGQSLVREQRRQANEIWRLQATRLAEAGLSRAVARRAADAQFDGETWSVPAKSLASAHAAEVRIGVTVATDGRTTRYEATAEYPAGARRRAQVTRRIEVSNPNPGNES